MKITFLGLIFSFAFVNYIAQKHEFILYTGSSELYHGSGDIQVYVNEEFEGVIDKGGKYSFKVKFDEKNPSFEIRLHKDGFEDKEFMFESKPLDSYTKLFWAMKKERFRLSEPKNYSFEIARIKFDIDPNEQVITIPYRKTYWSSIGIEEGNTSVFEKGIHNELLITGFNGLIGVDAEENLFEEKVGSGKEETADISVGAIIRNLKISGANYYADPNVVYDLSVEMEVEWQFYDNSAEELLIKTVTKESSFMVKETGNIIQGLILAFDENFAASLNNPDVIKKICSVVSDNDNAYKENTDQQYSISKPAQLVFNSFNEMIKGVNPSVVTIKGDKGHGSGFVISDEGYVITNYHVVKNNNDLKALFQMGFELPIEVLNYNEQHDVALLKVMGQGYKPISLASIPAEIGEEVVAIGTPNSTELSNTVTKGIVSAIRTNDDGIDLIQTDVSVSPGNSGGPLINSKGDVVGIVSQKIIDVSTDGIAFAIPIGLALEKLNVRLK